MDRRTFLKLAAQSTALAGIAATPLLNASPQLFSDPLSGPVLWTEFPHAPPPQHPIWGQNPDEIYAQLLGIGALGAYGIDALLSERLPRLGFCHLGFHTAEEIKETHGQELCYFNRELPRFAQAHRAVPKSKALTESLDHLACRAPISYVLLDASDTQDLALAANFLQRVSLVGNLGVTVVMRPAEGLELASAHCLWAINTTIIDIPCVMPEDNRVGFLSALTGIAALHRLYAEPQRNLFSVDLADMATFLSHSRYLRLSSVRLLPDYPWIDGRALDMAKHTALAELNASSGFVDSFCFSGLLPMDTEMEEYERAIDRLSAQHPNALGLTAWQAFAGLNPELEVLSTRGMRGDEIRSSVLFLGLNRPDSALFLGNDVRQWWN